MLNKETLINTYKNLISYDKTKFSEDTQLIKQKINFKALEAAPLLVYSRNKRNALYYVLCMFYSLKQGKVLTHSVITGQTLIDQHFASNENKDYKLLDDVFHNDISFISLNQYDYVNEYLEVQLINLIESRNQHNKITIVSIDVFELDKPYLNTAKKLSNYFAANNFKTIDLVNVTSKTFETSETPKAKRRIR
jgi:hypothetical protein